MASARTTRTKALERLGRLDQPGFPVAGRRRLIERESLEGILPLALQQILESKQTSPIFTSRRETDPTAGAGIGNIVEAIKQRAKDVKRRARSK